MRQKEKPHTHDDDIVDSIPIYTICEDATQYDVIYLCSPPRWNAYILTKGNHLFARRL